MSDRQINAVIHELETQRAMLGNRAATLAASNAALAEENDKLKKRIAELEKPSDEKA